MGTWGSGNLDSDGALDWVGEKSDALGASVWSSLQSKASTEADEDEYSLLFVELEMVLTLEKAKLFNGWGLPAVAELDPAFEIWLQAWDVYFDGLSGPEFKAERRAVIEETFGRFRAVCAKYEELRG